MVTVETALAVAVMVVVAVLATAVPMAVATAVRCADVAREVALLVARGAPRGEALAAVDVGLSDPRVAVRADGRWVTAVVTADAGPVGPLAGRFSWRVSGRAVAQAEPTAQEHR